MRHVLKTLGLLLLLIAAQQGAVVHELSHLSASSSEAVRADAAGAASSTCALCPVFAQAATPAFSHSFDVPLLGRAAPDIQSEPQYSAIDATVPRPRSRGPPSLS